MTLQFLPVMYCYTYLAKAPMFTLLICTDVPVVSLILSVKLKHDARSPACRQRQPAFSLVHIHKHLPLNIDLRVEAFSHFSNTLPCYENLHLAHLVIFKGFLL